MRVITCVVILIIALAGTSCERAEVAQEQTPPATANEPVSFVNKVWKVHSSSSVAPGQLYVFLSEGTLVVASQTGKPALGTWSYTDSSLTMVEEGIPYKVDILKLTQDEFSIRSHNPGEPVEMQLVPAPQQLPDSLRK